MMGTPRRQNLVGRRFGRLLVVSLHEVKNRFAYWLCACDCGAETICKGAGLNYGSSKSCGCLQRERASASAVQRLTTHGKTAGGNKRIYRVWSNMMSRCYNEKISPYRWYGARGIRVCAQWHEFSAFLRDMGEPSPGMTLDRIDSNGDYSPENCRWSTQREQCNNQRSNRLLTIEGVTKTISYWGDEPGAVRASTIYGRIARGWEPKRAVFQPIRKSACD